MIIKKKIQKPAEVIEEKPAVIESEKQVDEDKIDLFYLDNIDFKQRQERRRGDRRRGFRRIDDRNLISRAREEAQAIKEVAEAKAKEIQMVYDAIKKSDPDEKLVQLKSLEALEKVADGEANKVFIPFEATSALSSLGAIKEVMKDDKK